MSAGPGFKMGGILRGEALEVRYQTVLNLASTDLMALVFLKTFNAPYSFSPTRFAPLMRVLAKSVALW